MTRGRLASIGLGFLCWMLVLLFVTAVGIDAADARPITVASMDGAGNGSNGASGEPSISADGRYVAFSSWASNLVAGDSNGQQDVFVRDLISGTIVRVSVDSQGREGNGPSGEPSISADGRYVAFSSWASNLVADDSNGQQDVFVRDLSSGTTIRVSIGVAGEEGNGWSNEPSISADGRYVAFLSQASNLIDGDTNSRQDVFVRDLATGQTTRVSVDTEGKEANSGSWTPCISRDGRYVAFESWATNLVDGDSNALEDVFVHDRVTGETIRVSVDSSGNEGNSGSWGPSLSPDGRLVAFESKASNLVEGDTNDRQDIFVHHLDTGETVRVSVNSRGNEANGWSNEPSISANGRYVVFESKASNLVPGDTDDQWDIYVHDLGSGRTELVSADSSGTAGNRDSLQPVISAGGRYVAFVSSAGNLLGTDASGYENILVRDRGPHVDAAGVPTLDTWGLGILVLLIGAAALAALRRTGPAL